MNSAQSYSRVNYVTVSEARASIRIDNMIIVNCSLYDRARSIVENVKQLLYCIHGNLILQLSLVLLSQEYAELGDE